MYVLHSALPALGTRCSSPFATKAESLLRLAGVPFQRVNVNPTIGPRKKVPFLDTADGQRITDSYNIRRHLETHEGLALVPFALDHLVRRTVEEHLYFAQMYARWTYHPIEVREQFFADVPWPMRSMVFGIVARQVRSALYGQGLGRRPEAEILRIVRDDLDALEAVLPGPTFASEGTSLADVVTHAFLEQILPLHVEDPLVTEVRSRSRLVELHRRIDDTLYEPRAVEEVT